MKEEIEVQAEEIVEEIVDEEAVRDPEADDEPVSEENTETVTEDTEETEEEDPETEEDSSADEDNSVEESIDEDISAEEIVDEEGESDSADTISESDELLTEIAVEEAVIDAPEVVAPEKKGKLKNKKWLIPAIIVAVLAAAYFAGVLFYRYHFLPNTKLNEISLSNQDLNSAQEILKGYENHYELKLTDLDNKVEKITAQDVDLKVKDIGVLEKSLNNQNIWQWPIKWFKKDKGNAIECFNYNAEKLAAKKAELNMVKNAGTIETKNAQPVYENGELVIKEAVQGNTLNKEEFDKVLNTAVATGEENINLYEKNCYVKPTFYKDAPEVKTAKTDMEKFLGSIITYNMGTATEVIDRDRLGSWLKVDDKMKACFDREKVAAYISELAGKYNTQGQTHNFTTANGAQITVSGGSYGWKIDEEAELDELIPLLEAGQPATREPKYSSTALSRDANDIGNTFVEVDLAAQTLYYVTNGSVALSTPIVSGCVANGNATATGVFTIAYKARNAVLRGADYETPVSYWMPFDLANGNGMHDADGWRSAYGGSYYINGGSHGCINMPTWAVSQLFNSASEGTPVVVHN